MYCKNCGKQLSDEAIMCPECGTPTGIVATAPIAQKIEKTESETHNTPVGIIGFFLSSFSFVTGIIFGALMLVFSGLVGLLVVGTASILPGLAGISLCIYGLKSAKGAAKPLSITGIVLASVALLFLFIITCFAFAVVAFY